MPSVDELDELITSMLGDAIQEADARRLILTLAAALPELDAEDLRKQLTKKPILQNNTVIHRWSIHAVSTWLGCIGMEIYVRTFREQEVSGCTLLGVTSSKELLQMDVAVGVHRK
jgi:hypothetical protein